MMTIGALIILSLTVLLTNRSSLQYGAIINQTEVDIYSVSLAQSIIEEAAGKAFDHFSATDTAGDGNVITSLSQLSATLGAESDDTLTPTARPTKYFFDDFDDYNSWNATPFYWYISGAPDTFRIRATVFYIDSANPELAVTSKTWHKKIVVRVWPNSIAPWGDKNPRPDTVIMSYIYSYWWFR
jgi:hypothetical protein